VPVAVEHASALAALVRQDIGQLRAYLPALVPLASAAAAATHLQAMVERAAAGGFFEWHLFTGATLCGSVRLKDIDPADRKAQIGYFVGSGFTGKGIATAAAAAVLAHGFDRLGLNRVELRCASDNVASMRVAARLGFVHEGTLRQNEYLHGRFVDHHVHGLLAAEFTPYHHRE
jgi:ribosomal-protein-serine acetyltransferase